MPCTGINSRAKISASILCLDLFSTLATAQCLDSVDEQAQTLSVLVVGRLSALLLIFLLFFPLYVGYGDGLLIEGCGEWSDGVLPVARAHGVPSLASP